MAGTGGRSSSVSDQLPGCDQGVASRRSAWPEPGQASAAQFGSSAEIASAVINPDGSALYFTTNLTGARLADEGSHETWQLRVADLATGQSRTVKSFAGFTGSVSADPSVRYLLLQLQPALGTASQSRVQSPSAACLAAPKQGKAHAAPLPKACPSTSPSAAPSVRLARLDIAAGQVAYLRAPWIGSGAWIAW
jgi:hypothetical protein